MLTTEIRTRTETRHTLRLSGKLLCDIVSQELAAQGADRIPANATVVVHIPGGGDWSNTELDIDERHPVEISWNTVEESQP
jgi:hypothetical protein